MIVFNVYLALLLARTCVAEIGLQEDVAECELMWTINQRNADIKGRTIEEQTRLYNQYWRSPWLDSTRPYIRHMVGPKKPNYWPRSMSWAKHRYRWLAYLAAAERFVINPDAYSNLCPGAIDYGAKNEIPDRRDVVPVKGLGRKTKQKYWRIRVDKKEILEKGLSGIATHREITNCRYCKRCTNCISCTNCTDCVECGYQTDKHYMAKNVQLTKEEYRRFMED